MFHSALGETKNGDRSVHTFASLRSSSTGGNKMCDQTQKWSQNIKFDFRRGKQQAGVWHFI
jgi:hypothetical protein